MKIKYKVFDEKKDTSKDGTEVIVIKLSILKRILGGKVVIITKWLDYDFKPVYKVVTNNPYKFIREETKVMFWFIFGAIIVGALLENKIAVLVGTFMISTLLCVYAISKYFSKS